MVMLLGSTLQYSGHEHILYLSGMTMKSTENPASILKHYHKI